MTIGAISLELNHSFLITLLIAQYHQVAYTTVTDISGILTSQNGFRAAHKRNLLLEFMSFEKPFNNFVFQIFE